jgi:hypothetical protein
VPIKIWLILRKLFHLRKTILSVGPGILWLIISTILLTIPGNNFPKENVLDKIWFDKWVHIGMFAIMVVLWCWALKRTRKESSQLKKIFIVISILAWGYGIGMEFVQRYWVTNRSFDLGDIAADGIGCIAGFFYSVRRYIKN